LFPVTIAISATETMTQGSVMRPALQARLYTALRGRHRQPRTPLYSPYSRTASANTHPEVSRLPIGNSGGHHARAAERDSRAALLVGSLRNIANRTPSACAASMRSCKGAPGNLAPCRMADDTPSNAMLVCSVGARRSICGYA
jgi:hypothetical protein